MIKAVFEGLVIDEHDRPCPVVYVGNDPTYVVTERGFHYHVDSRKVDSQVLDLFLSDAKSRGSELSVAMMKIIGSDDIFTKARVDAQVKNLDKDVPRVYETGLPEDQRVMLGMMGFRVVINHHGDMVKLEMPKHSGSEDE